MDIETIKQLQANRAGIVLQLKQVLIRNMFTEWHLIALFEILDTLGKKPIPASVVVITNRSRQLIVNQCESAGVSFTEFPLPVSAGIGRKLIVSRSEGQCQQSCHLCFKTEFDTPTGCYNPNVFSAGAGDWLCNLVRY